MRLFEVSKGACSERVARGSYRQEVGALKGPNRGLRMLAGPPFKLRMENLSRIRLNAQFKYEKNNVEKLTVFDHKYHR